MIESTVKYGLADEQSTIGLTEIGTGCPLNCRRAKHASRLFTNGVQMFLRTIMKWEQILRFSFSLGFPHGHIH